MYEILTKGEHPLVEKLSFYKGDTSEIYKVDDLLYKIYLKREPFKRHILDYLIHHHDELKPFSTPPIRKLKIDDMYGMKMRYVDSVDFLTYLRSKDVPPKEMVRILRILSDNLKEINSLGIHFPDLHHHNILIRKSDNYPLYTDLDDASVGEYPSTHICTMAHLLHNVKNKSYQYEGELIHYGNLDQECLVLMLLDYMFDRSIERLSYDEFQRKIDELQPYFESDFLQIASQIKDHDDNQIVNPYPYYLGDYMTEPSFIQAVQKVKRRNEHANSNISTNK